METITQWWRVMRCVMYIMVILYIPACQSGEQSIPRTTQDNMQCKTVVQVEWGNGTGELGYIPANQSNIYPGKPFRFQIDDKGNVYVADLHNQRILEFTSGGDFLRSLAVPILEDEKPIADIAVGGDRIAVATTDHVYVFDLIDGSSQILEWPTDTGQYGLCSEDMAGRKVQVDRDGNIYACGVGGFERGGTIVQFDRDGHSRKFFVGAFDHFVVGWDGIVYVEQLSYAGTIEAPSDSQILKFDLRGNHLGEVTIHGSDLAEAGLTYPGLLIAVDVRGNLYGSVTNVIRDNKLVSLETLVQISTEGRILRIVERDKFTRPSTDVLDGKGNLYTWHFGEIPSEPAEIWRCNP